MKRFLALLFLVSLYANVTAQKKTYHPDCDNDGEGSPEYSKTVVSPPKNGVNNKKDCNDSDPAINTKAVEICGDGVDNNCDGKIDDNTLLFYADTDLDGFGSPTNAITACSMPGGYVANALDCDDANAAINPIQPEVCNSVDDNCINGIDDGLEFKIYYPDVDKDGFGQLTDGGLNLCSDPGEGYSLLNTDCNDANPAIFPGAIETPCDNIDQDCSGGDQEGNMFTYYFDPDGNGYGDDPTADTTCCCPSPPAGYVTSLAPVTDFILTDSKKQLVRELWGFTDADIWFRSSLTSYDVMQQSYLEYVHSLNPQNFCFNEGATTDHFRLLVGETRVLRPDDGGEGGYNCLASGPDVLQGMCGKKFKLNGKIYDFFNSHVEFADTLQVLTTYTANIQIGTLEELYWALDRTKANRVMFGQEQNIHSNAPFYPKGGVSYVEKTNPWIDSVKKYYPSVITVADVGDILTNVPITKDWNNGLMATKADNVDIYLNIHDWINVTEDVVRDTAEINRIIKEEIPKAFDELQKKYPGKGISISQYSPSESFSNKEPLYKGTFLAASMIPKMQRVFWDYNLKHDNIIDCAIYETLKSVSDQFNKPDIHGRIMQIMGNLFLTNANVMEVKGMPGALILSCKSTAGKVKIFVMTGSNAVTLPPAGTIDGIYTPIGWGSNFMYWEGLLSTEAIPYVPEGIMRPYSIGYFEF